MSFKQLDTVVLTNDTQTALETPNWCRHVLYAGSRGVERLLWD